MKLLDSIAAAMPAGKALFGLVVGAITIFGAGFGVAFGFGETAANIKLVPVLVATQETMQERMTTFQVRLDNADVARGRILCLVRLTVTGETILAIEIDERCPL